MSIIGYDDLKTAWDWADNAEEQRQEEWAPAEGLDPEDLIRFSADIAVKTFGSANLNQTHAVAVGVAIGLRLMNLVHRTKNPDPSDL